MARTELSDAIVEELGELFVSELRQAGSELVASDLDGIARRLQELSRRVLGRVVEAVITTIAAGQPVERPACGQCRQPMRAVAPARPRALQGLVATTGCVGRISRAIGVGTASLRWTSGSGSGRARCRQGRPGWRVGSGSRRGSARPPTSCTRRCAWTWRPRPYGG